MIFTYIENIPSCFSLLNYALHHIYVKCKTCAINNSFNSLSSVSLGDKKAYLNFSVNIICKIPEKKYWYILHWERNQHKINAELTNFFCLINNL